MGMCEWTDCPDKPMLHTRSAYSPSNVLPAFVTVEIAITLGGHASARSCHDALNADGDQMCTEWS